MALMIDPRHIYETWNVIYNAQSNRTQPPTSPNDAPATPNDPHEWCPSHMKRHLQCAEQQVSYTKITKCCACHEKWLASLILVTFEMSFTMRGATGLILQRHQILCLPRKMTRIIDPRDIWNVIYNARSNRCHPPTSPSTVPATKNDSHHWSSWHMKRHLQCAEQQDSSSNVNKYCTCHAKWLSWVMSVTYQTSFTMRGATGITLQPHQMLRLPRKIALQNLRKICRKQLKRHFQCAADSTMIRTWSEHDPNMIRPWNCKTEPVRSQSLLFPPRQRILYWKLQRFALRLSTQISPNTAPATKSDTPRSPNTAPATQNDSHDWCPSHMKRHLQCAEQQVSSSNVTKYCTCHEKWRAWFTLVTYETSFTMRGGTGITRQPHQILRLPRKMTLMLDLRHIWNVIYNARSNRHHPPTSPNTAPATQKCTPKSKRNSPRTVEASIPMRGRFDHDPNMIRPWTRHLAPARSPRLLFALRRRILYWKLQHFALRLFIQISPNTAPATKTDTPRSPNTAPATQNDSHDWCPSHMTRHLQCAEQQISSSNITKCCACHAKWLASSILVTYETLFTMRGGTGITCQPHQILRLPHKMTRIIYPRDIWNVIYNARRNRHHPPTSPNTAPATQNDSHDWSSSHMKRYLQCAKQQASPSNLTKYCACHAKVHSKIKEKFAENSWSVNSNAGPIRTWSDHDLYPDFTEYCACHKKWHSKITKYCACHEKWHWSVWLYWAVTELLLNWAVTELLLNCYWTVTELLLNCYWTVTELLLSCYWTVTELLLSCYWAVTELLLSCYWAVTELLLSCYWTVTELLLNCYWTVTELFLNCYWTVAELLLSCYWTVTELLLSCYWTVTELLLNCYWTVTDTELSCYWTVTELNCYWTVTDTELSCYWAVTELLLSCYWPVTELLLNWAVTELLLNCYWAVTDLLLNYYWTELLLSCYWNVTELLLNCYWAVTELLLNRYWYWTELLLSCYWTVTELLLNCYWAVTELLLNRYWYWTELLLSCYWTVTELLLSCYWPVTELLLNWAVTELLLKCYWAVTELLLSCYWTVTEPLLILNWAVTELLLNCYWTVTELYWTATELLLNCYWTVTDTELSCYWAVTELLLNWTVTEPLLILNWAVTELLLNCYWTVTELLLNCYWTVTELLLNRYWYWTELLLSCYWTVTELLLNWTVTELSCYCIFKSS